MVLVDDGVALAASDEPAVDRHGDDEGDGEHEGGALQDDGAVEVASIAPGTSRLTASSTIPMMVMENVSAASATGTAARSARPERMTGPMGKA